MIAGRSAWLCQATIPPGSTIGQAARKDLVLHEVGDRRRLLQSELDWQSRLDLPCWRCRGSPMPFPIRGDMDQRNRLRHRPLAYWSRPEARPSQSRNDLRRPEVSASNLSPLVADARESYGVTDYREKDVLALQGGGALGAYQAGAYEALCDGGHMPRWVAGTSIGAINAAIIAGNQPERRVSGLRGFWGGVSSCLLSWAFAED